MSAIDRITHYVAMREAKPMRGMADEIHGIHAGEEWEARLFLSDIKEIASAIRAQSKRIAELEAEQKHLGSNLASIEFAKMKKRAEAAESRLAEIDRYRGEAEKVAEQMLASFADAREMRQTSFIITSALLSARMEGEAAGAVELKRTREALEIAREYLDNHSDCVDGDYGVPAPNDAMKCLQEINEAMEAKS